MSLNHLLNNDQISKYLNPWFNSLNILTDAEIQGNLTVDGNLILNGSLNLLNIYVSVSLPNDGGQFQGTDEVPIQQAIDYLYNASKRGTVFIKSGTYTINNKILLKPNISILGEGRNSVILYGNGVDYIIKSDVSELAFDSIREITFSGVSTISHIELISSAFTIDFCTFDGTNLSLNAISLIDNGSFIQFNNIMNCFFFNFIDKIIKTSSLNGVAKIINNLLSGNNIGEYGIYSLGPIQLSCNNIFANLSFGIYTEHQFICENCKFANCNTVLKQNIIAFSFLPIPVLILFNDNYIINFGITDYIIDSSVDITFSGEIHINGLGLSSPVNISNFNFTGLGNHTYYINGLTFICSSIFDNLGIITNDSFINQPNSIQSIVPTNSSLGMIYLDDGTNTISTNPAWRRFNGIAYIDL